MTVVRGYSPSRAARVATHEHKPAPPAPRLVRSVEPLENPTMPPSPEDFWRCRWFAIWTWPGREWSPKALSEKENAEVYTRRCAEAGLRELGLLTYVPLTVRWITHAAIRRAVERPLLPRYVLIGSPAGPDGRPRDPDWYAVRASDFVSGVCGEGSAGSISTRPLLLPVQNLVELAGRQVAGEFDLTRGDAPPILMEGDMIRVTGGPFATFDGVVNEKVPADHPVEKPVEILLKIFGRDTISHIPLADLVERNYSSR